MLETPKTTISLNIYFRKHLNLFDIKQVIEVLDDRLKDLEMILKDMFEEDYAYMSVSIVREDSTEVRS